MPDIFCPKSIQGLALRATRNDICDIALDPLVPNSRFQVGTFMELTLSPDMEGGEDTTMKAANGSICIRHKDADRLKGFEATLKICGLPLPQMEMLLDTAVLLDDDANMVGGVLRESKGSAEPASKSLEIWSLNVASRCIPGQAGAGVYIHWLLPRSTNWELSGDIAFNQSAMELELTGYIENNPNWFPSYPGDDFPSYVPGGGDPDSQPSGVAGPVLPFGIEPDGWTLADQAAIQAGGPLAWRATNALPSPLDDCAYAPSDLASV